MKGHLGDSEHQAWQMRGLSDVKAWVWQGLATLSDSETGSGMLNQVRYNIYVRFIRRRIWYVMQKTRFYSLIKFF